MTFRLNRVTGLLIAFVVALTALIFVAPEQVQASSPDCNPTELTGGNIGVNEHVLQFTNSSLCTWTVPTGVTSVHVLVVAGGGGGGAPCGGGGGGGGGVINESDFAVSGQVSVIAGAAGQGGLGGNGCTNSAGENGGDSRFDSLTAIGGGGGGTAYVHVDGLPGGSGGGSAGAYNVPTVVGAATVGQGFAGGQGRDDYFDPPFSFPGGGGGGAGGAGESPIDHAGGDGGAGYASAISGATVYYAGGGGGATDLINSGGVGGSGCGGHGGAGFIAPNIVAPTAASGFGCGGGGADGTFSGADGSAGVILVRYSVASTPTASLPNTGEANTHGLGIAGGLILLIGTALLVLWVRRRA